MKRVLRTSAERKSPSRYGCCKKLKLGSECKSVSDKTIMSGKFGRPLSDLQFMKDVQPKKKMQPKEEGRILQLENKAKQLEGENGELKISHQSLIAKLEATAKENQGIKIVNENLEERILHLEGGIKLLKRENDDLKISHVSLTPKLAELEEKNEGLKIVNENLEERILHLEGGIKLLKRENDDLKILHVSLTPKLEELVEENQGLKNVKKNLEEHVETLRNKIKGLKEKSVNITDETIPPDAVCSGEISTTLGEATGSNPNVLSLWGLIDSVPAFRIIENRLIESLDLQRELIAFNQNINVADEETYMKIYLRRLFTMNFFCENIALNARGGKVNFKHKTLLHCFSINMKQKFEKQKSDDEQEEKRLLLKYELKIINFVGSFRDAVKRNNNLWYD